MKNGRMLIGFSANCLVSAKTKALVKKGEDILVALCGEIERRKPSTLEELYALTHAATNQFNDLQGEFADQDSEIETGAREAIAKDFEQIAKAYGFVDADTEELIATRDRHPPQKSPPFPSFAIKLGYIGLPCKDYKHTPAARTAPIARIGTTCALRRPGAFKS